MAVPVAIGVALFIAYYAPRRLAQGLGYVVDLLAAVPSVVYGLWGLIFLVPHLIPLSEWLAQLLRLDTDPQHRRAASVSRSSPRRWCWRS